MNRLMDSLFWSFGYCWHCFKSKYWHRESFWKDEH